MWRVAVSAAAIVVMPALPVRGQTVRPDTKPAPPKAAASKACRTPKTPWGDPDLSGIFANNDQSGIPLERPNQFDGKKLDDISDSELAELRHQRNRQAEERAPNLGVLPGSNPVHWFENFGAKNSRAWLIVDPRAGRGRSPSR